MSPLDSCTSNTSDHIHLKSQYHRFVPSLLIYKLWTLDDASMRSVKTEEEVTQMLTITWLVPLWENRWL